MSDCIICYLSGCCLCVRMIRLEVPEMSLLGDTVAMHCYYHMEGEQLYSVKWYKEGQEFFRYLNVSHILPTITNDIPGIFLGSKTESGHLILQEW